MKEDEVRKRGGFLEENSRKEKHYYFNQKCDHKDKTHTQKRKEEK